MKISKKLLLEAMIDAISEMPKEQLYFVLNRDWKQNAEKLKQETNKSGKRGYNNLTAGLEKLSKIGHDLLTTNDFVKVFSFPSNASFNMDLKKDLLKYKVIQPWNEKNMLNIEPDEEDFFSADEEEKSTYSNLSKEADIDLLLKKIKIDPSINRIILTRKRIWNKGKHSYKPYSWADEDEYDFFIVKEDKWVTSKFKFFKPFIEEKYSQKITSPATLTKTKNSYWSDPQEVDIDTLFPDRRDFAKFMADHIDIFTEIDSNKEYRNGRDYIQRINVSNPGTYNRVTKTVINDRTKQAYPFLDFSTSGSPDRTEYSLNLRTYYYNK